MTAAQQTRILAAIFIIYAIALAGITAARNAVWHDPVRLWEDVAAKSSRKARAHTNLGQTFSHSGRMDEARQQYAIAITLDPDYAAAHAGIAVSTPHHAYPAGPGMGSPVLASSARTFPSALP